MSASDDRRTAQQALDQGAVDHGASNEASPSVDTDRVGSSAALNEPGSARATTTDASPPAAQPETEGVYFFPEEPVSEERVRALLEGDDDDAKAWVVAHLLIYGQWQDIWTWVDRATVRALFPKIELPERLRAAWARTLGIEAP